jgi:hypothetical protein
MKKTALAVIAGLVAWWIAFYASLFAFVLAWPALNEAVRPALESNEFSRITTPMWALFLSMYLWVNPIAGWVTAVIGKKRSGVWIAAGIMGLYAAFMHYYVLWGVYPSWYNLLVPISIPPLMYLGARWTRAS